MKGIGLIALGVVVLGISIVLGGWVFSGFTMTSSAMDPTFASGKMVFVSRVVKSIGRGSVVLAQVPGEETQVVRRIVALPGETIEYHDGKVFINGAELDEKYLGFQTETAAQFDVPAPPSYGPVTLTEDTYFLMGDNRKFARDSRVFSAVASSAILGKVISFGGILVF